MAEDIKGDLRSSIESSRFVSILSDGSTDKGIIEEEIVYVQFVDGKPHTKLVSVESPNFVDAAGIMTAIQDSIDTLKLDENETEEFFIEFYKKLININFDGASFMSGNWSGVQERFKNIVAGLIYTHCVAHRLELAMLDALELNDSYIQKFDENINSIFKFYYYSPVRRKVLKEMAKEIKVEFKQLGLLKKHWMVSESIRSTEYFGIQSCYSIWSVNHMERTKQLNVF